MKVDCACHCGFITIEAEIDPEKITTCLHRLPIRQWLGVPCLGADAGRKLQDDLSADALRETATSGNRRRHGFCPKCGLSIYSTTPGEGSKDFYMLRVGIFTPARSTYAQQQIRFRSAQPWVGKIADLSKSDTQQGTSHLG